jgi:hypothetical protein
VVFSGARIDLYIAEADDVRVIKGDKQDIGYVSSDLSHEFTEHKIDTAGTVRMFYMTTDGYIDQLGGLETRRFGTARFKKLLAAHHTSPLADQRLHLMAALDLHRGENSQTDDITVAGFSFSDEDSTST